MLFEFQEYWIGLNDKNSPGKFAWVDGTPLNDTMNNNWRPGEPSSSFGSEDCVEIYGHWLPGKWNDNHCNSLRDYICEKNSGLSISKNEILFIKFVRNRCMNLLSFLFSLLDLFFCDTGTNWSTMIFLWLASQFLCDRNCDR